MMAEGKKKKADKKAGSKKEKKEEKKKEKAPEKEKSSFNIKEKIKKKHLFAVLILFSPIIYYFSIPEYVAVDRMRLENASITYGSGREPVSEIVYVEVYRNERGNFFRPSENSTFFWVAQEELPKELFDFVLDYYQENYKEMTASDRDFSENLLFVEEDIEGRHVYAAKYAPGEPSEGYTIFLMWYEGGTAFSLRSYGMYPPPSYGAYREFLSFYFE